MWKEITTNQDITNFMELISGFHDSCIKELRYYSGAYVNKDLSMYPVNENNSIRMIVQRQYDSLSMIELEFNHVKYLRLTPVDKDYTCEILDASIFIIENNIYWCDEQITENEVDSYKGTMICASQLRWREIINCMGSDEFFKPVS